MLLFLNKKQRVAIDRTHTCYILNADRMQRL